MFGDGGVSSGAVGRYVSVGDASVPCGGDMESCGVDTVLSGAVGGGLCDLDRVSGGSDTDVSGEDTVVSGAVSGCLCDLDSVSRGGIVVCVLVRCRCQVVAMQSCRVLRSLCVMSIRCWQMVSSTCVVLTDGIIDLCGVDTVVSGDDESVCGVISVMSAGVLHLCGIDTAVSGVDEPVCGVSSVMTASELACVVVTA